MSHGQNVTVDIMIGSKCHRGRSELGRNVQAAWFDPWAQLVGGGILERRIAEADNGTERLHYEDRGKI